MNEKWTTDQIPNLSGKVMIITGANSGLGFETALALAEKGATAILACRNMQKGNIAFNNIKLQFPKAKLELIELDLANRQSIEGFVETFLGKYSRLDVLINNAGIFGTYKETTKDGYEMQLGVNHLGHYILTGLLLPLLQNTPESRIVHLSSLVAATSEIYFEDIMLQNKKYPWMKSYGQSKLAVLLFALELDRRLNAAGSHIKSIPIHPGISKTSIFANAKVSPIIKFIMTGSLAATIMQESSFGALPQIYAATSPDAEGGKYYGPDGKKQQKGYPTEIKLPKIARNEEIWAKLWKTTEEITGMVFL